VQAGIRVAQNGPHVVALFVGWKTAHCLRGAESQNQLDDSSLAIQSCIEPQSIAYDVSGFKRFLIRSCRSTAIAGALEEFSMSKKIFVGNLPFSMGEAELRELFAQKGAVDSATVMRDVETGRSRGFAFVEMANDEEAEKAIKELNGYSAEGRNLTVNEARPKTERRGGFGGGRGGGRGRPREPRW